MRRYYALTARGQKFFYNCARKRLSLVGIGAAAQLVYQNETFGIYAVYNLNHRFYVRGKG